MECKHYFVDGVGEQKTSDRAAELLGRKTYTLGNCVICGCSLDVSSFIDSGERFEGKPLLFSPKLVELIKETYSPN